MVDYPLFALIVLVACCIAGGVVSAVVATWRLRATTYELDSRLTVVEGNLQREVKARAGQERWKKPDKDLEMLKQVQAATPARPLNWWERTAAK